MPSPRQTQPLAGLHDANAVSSDASAPDAALAQQLGGLAIEPDDVARRRDTIARQLLETSPHLKTADFEAIAAQDLATLFELYDKTFFGGAFRPALGHAPLTFRLSRRLTRAGAKTTHWHGGRGGERFEITVSAHLLFSSFSDNDHRDIRVCGLPCRDRLRALLHLFEHELVHLAEMVVLGESSCRAPRFQQIAHRWFKHTEHTHDLITPRERAGRAGIRVGARVRFTFEGEPVIGHVNRITKRVTVLVEHPRGVRYSDGRRYAKFYVPMDQLTPA